MQAMKGLFNSKKFIFPEFTDSFRDFIEREGKLPCSLLEGTNTFLWNWTKNEEERNIVGQLLLGW